MANPEHLALLEQGVEAWNKWRQENSDIKPDLCKVDLNKADLRRTHPGRVAVFALLTMFCIDLLVKRASQRH